MRPEGSIDLRTPRRTSPAGALLGVFAVDQLRPLLPVVIVAASSGRFLVVLGVAVVLGLAFNVATWWRRTWWLVDDVLHLDEGILVRSQRRIPVERIQHVELEQRLRHQLFDLSIVRVETAAGSGAELRLDSVSTRQAEDLRAAVVASGTVRPADPVGAPPPEVLVRLPPGRLLLAGITGPEVLAVLAALAVGLDVLTDLGVDPDDFGRVEATALAVAALVVVAVPAWFLAAGLIGVVRRWDLTATVRGGDLRVTYGLLRKAEFTVDLSRVQDVRIAHRLLLRPFGRADLRVRTAASGASEHSRVDIPLLGHDEIASVLARVLPSALPLPALGAAPSGARRRALLRSGFAGALIGAGVGALSWSAPVVAATVTIGIVAGLGRGEAFYRGLGAATSGDGATVHSRAGSFTRHHAIVPVGRLQSSGVGSSWFQRRRDLATVRLDLAGAHVEVIDRGAAEAVDLAAMALPA